MTSHARVRSYSSNFQSSNNNTIPEHRHMIMTPDRRYITMDKVIVFLPRYSYLGINIATTCRWLGRSKAVLVHIR